MKQNKLVKLMIGDWVYDRRDDLALTEINPMRVTGIVKNGAFCQFGNDSYTITVSIDYIAPIRLTAEILEKNGLVVDDITMHFAEDKDFKMELSMHGSEVWWTINLQEYDIIRLDYVHELQHALRLCGIEKEIEL